MSSEGGYRGMVDYTGYFGTFWNVYIYIGLREAWFQGWRFALKRRCINQRESDLQTEMMYSCSCHYLFHHSSIILEL